MFLVPRLNYSFGFKNFIYSLYSIYKPRTDTKFISAFFENKHVFYVNHARTGLRLALNSLNLRADARIGVQIYNCHTVFNAIKLAGFKPVFIDITNDFKISLSDLIKKCDNIDALILTHTFGIPSNLTEVKKIMPNVPIIEDCAHSFLSEIKGAITGKFGDFAVFSMGHAKFPSIADGGFLLVNNTKYLPEILVSVKELKSQTLIAEIRSIFKSSLLSILHNPFLYKNLTIPFLKKLDNNFDFGGKFKQMEANILRSSLGLFLYNLDKFRVLMKQQQNNAQKIANVLRSINSDVYIPLLSQSEGVNCFMLPILIKNRSVLIDNMHKAGIEIGSHFSKSIFWAEQFGYFRGDCPNAEQISELIVTFPCHYNLKANYINRIIKNINRLYK